MKNKSFIIMKKKLLDNFSIFKTFIYIFIILIISYYLIFKTANIHSPNLSLLDVQAQLVSNYFMFGFFIIIGIPFLLYLVLLSAGAISREVDKGTFLLIFSRPIRRFDVLLGKFLGIFIYFFLVNAFILFLLPALGSLFLGLSTSTLFLLYKTSFILLIYSIFITAFIVSLAFVFSSKFKKTIATAVILFIIVLGIFLIPAANLGGQETKYTNSFASLGLNILNGFNLDLSPNSKREFGQITGTYEARAEASTYPSQIVEPSRIKSIPSWLSLILIIFLSSALFLLSYFFIKRKEIY